MMISRNEANRLLFWQNEAKLRNGINSAIQTLAASQSWPDPRIAAHDPDQALPIPRAPGAVLASVRLSFPIKCRNWPLARPSLADSQARRIPSTNSASAVQ